MSKNKRMMHECFFQSEDVAEWSIRQRYLVVGIITIADDQGRSRANPKWLRAKLFAYDDVTPKEISDDLQHIQETNDTLMVYDVEGKKYIQLTNWWEYQQMQWAKPSEYPSPQEWTDRIRINVYKPKQWVMTSNWTGIDDCVSYESALVARGQRSKTASEKVESLGSPLPSSLGISNSITNTNTDSDTNADALKDDDFPFVQSTPPQPTTTEPYLPARKAMEAVSGPLGTNAIEQFDTVMGLIDVHGYSGVFGGMKDAYENWIKTKSKKTGRRYSPTNYSGWVNWTVSSLNTGIKPWAEDEDTTEADWAKVEEEMEDERVRNTYLSR